MVLSKSDLRDPLNPLFEFRTNDVYLQKKIVPIDHHAKFNIF